MTDQRQEAFLQRIRQALGSAEGESFAQADQTQQKTETSIPPPPRSEREQDDLVQRLIDAGQALHMQVRLCSDMEAVAVDVTDLARSKVQKDKGVVAWDHHLLRELKLDKRLAEKGIRFSTTGWEGTATSDAQRLRQRTTIRRQVSTAFMGITSADFCLADTATLVMKTRSGQARSASLVPEIHAAVIRKNQIIADLQELYFLLAHDPEQVQEGLTNCLTMISGPSKTADIEMCMVHGVHGPRELHLFVLP